MAKIKNKKDAQYYQEVIEHKKKVMDIMYDIANMIMKRGYIHDDSKLQDEFDSWVEYYIPENERDIESEEYKKSFEALKEVREQHYMKNRHHMEFYNGDIKKINVVDLIEIIVDWIASASSQDKGNLRVTIEKARERFKFSKDIESIILNTLELVETIQNVKGEY